MSKATVAALDMGIMVTHYAGSTLESTDVETIVRILWG
jgi:hypothetical protein